MQYFFKAFQNFSNFNGRARRKEYWYFVLFNVIVSVLVAVISDAIRVPAIYLVYVLIALLPGLAVGIRRMHDVGKSGWFIFIPFYNLVLTMTKYRCICDLLFQSFPFSIKLIQVLLHECMSLLRHFLSCCSIHPIF